MPQAWSPAGRRAAGHERGGGRGGDARARPRGRARGRARREPCISRDFAQKWGICRVSARMGSLAGGPLGRRHFRDYRRKEAHLYKVGDKVVYPHHGAGTVVKREKREVLGEKREYLTIKILHNDMTVNVPADNAERVGLRKVIDEEAGKKGA